LAAAVLALNLILEVVIVPGHRFDAEVGETIGAASSVGNVSDVPAGRARLRSPDWRFS
jgi:hypothetical protein